MGYWKGRTEGRRYRAEEERRDRREAMAERAYQNQIRRQAIQDERSKTAFNAGMKDRRRDELNRALRDYSLGDKGAFNDFNTAYPDHQIKQITPTENGGISLSTGVNKREFSPEYIDVLTGRGDRMMKRAKAIHSMRPKKRTFSEKESARKNLLDIKSKRIQVESEFRNLLDKAATDQGVHLIEKPVEGKAPPRLIDQIKADTEIMSYYNRLNDLQKEENRLRRLVDGFEGDPTSPRRQGIQRPQENQPPKDNAYYEKLSAERKRGKRGKRGKK